VHARPDRIALLGARPERADTGYGYIAPGRAVDAAGAAFRVIAFHEKPARGLATRIIHHGGLWNSFVMVARVDRLLALLATVRPDDVAALASVRSDPEALAPVYDCLPAWNFSRAFLAHIPEHLVVVRADDLGWSDLGTPDAIERAFALNGLVPPWREPRLATA
jgi:mannose-1-phosphate guanylyltransferase